MIDEYLFTWPKEVGNTNYQIAKTGMKLILANNYIKKLSLFPLYGDHFSIVGT